MIAATGIAGIVLDGAANDANPTPYLREKKSRKYMGLQDELAVVCAGRALAEARLEPSAERTGLYVAVGYIPFRERDIDPVLEGSLVDGELSSKRFAAEGYLRAHPLLAFRCLPNMPAYHVAANFGIEGPYTVSYPTAGQLYLALEQAVMALDDGRVDAAIVVGVADQRNFLVAHHFNRVEPPVPSERIADAGAAVVLEREEGARARGVAPRALLRELSIAYRPFDPRTTMPRVESARELGPAEPLLCLLGAHGRVEHRYQGRDGIAASALWEAP